MPKVAVFNMEGKQVGDLELSELVFGVEENHALLHQVIVNQLANRRQGTVATKNRSAVRGGGRKPWRQKGTGRARHGTRRSPLWVGGGTAFGPQPRSHSFKMPKKARRAALKVALSAKVRDGEFIVVDNLNLEEPKTKTMANVLNRLQAAKKPLIVLGDRNENVEMSARNIPGTDVASTTGLNVYDILAHEHLVLTQQAVEALEEVLV